MGGSIVRIAADSGALLVASSAMSLAKQISERSRGIARKQAALQDTGSASCAERHWRSSAGLQSAQFCWRWLQTRARREAAVEQEAAASGAAVASAVLAASGLAGCGRHRGSQQLLLQPMSVLERLSLGEHLQWVHLLLMRRQHLEQVDIARCNGSRRMAHDVGLICPCAGPVMGDLSWDLSWGPVVVIFSWIER